MKLSRLSLAALGLLFALPVFAQTQSTPLRGGTLPPAAGSQALRSAPPASSTAPQPPSASPQGALVDINSASPSALDALPGIGKARAEAIIKNRPYRGKDDLLARHILPQNVYNGIKDKIVARQG